MTGGEMVQAYRDGAQRLRRAVEGLAPEDLDARPGPGAWSIRQVVLHLQDSEAVLIDRMRRVLAEEDPLLVAFDENRFVERLHYERQSIEDALLLIEVGRRQWARVLETLAPEAFQRCGRHSVAGQVSLGSLLQGAIDHLEHHLAFLLEKRRRLGKPADL
ncbi:MAG: hypothetical protein KatS3mg110_3628 [Pirellulaceae bacterium]|nr:MAG: hypothetical protein KatS3mg110_3628 [Pirellulaceae bacterium]